MGVFLTIDEFLENFIDRGRVSRIHLFEFHPYQIINIHDFRESISKSRTEEIRHLN